MRVITVFLALVGLSLGITTVNKIDSLAPAGSWWVRSNPVVTAKDIYYSAFGNNKWVFLAGGTEDQIFPQLFTTPDLKTFTSSAEFNVSVQQDNTALVYGHAGFMAAMANTIAISKDGIKWSNYTTNMMVNTLAYGNGYYLAAFSPMGDSSNPLVYASKDGYSWKTYTLPLLDQGYFSITFANNSFWVYGYQVNSNEVTQALSTTDFVTWEIVPLGGASQATVNIIFETSTNQMVAVTTNTDYQVVIFGSSKDNVWWNQYGTLNMTNPAETTLAVYGNGILLIWTGNWVATQDFQTFRNITFPYVLSEWTLWGISFTNGKFVATGAEGLIATSPDGINWSLLNEGFLGNTVGLISHNGVFSLGTNSDINPNNGIYTSTDGVAWQLASSIPNGLWGYDYSEVEDLYFGFETNYVYYSKKTIAATFQQISTPLELSSVAVGNGVWVITYNNPQFSGSTGIVMASTDLTGSNWATTFQYTGPGCPPCRREDVVSNAVFASGNFYVLNYLTGALLTSPNGQGWTNRTLPCPNWEGPLVAGGGYLYVNCLFSNYSSYYLMATKDGKNWLPVTGLWGAFFLDYSKEAQKYVGLTAMEDYNTGISLSDDGLTWTSPSPLSYSLSIAQAQSVALGKNLFVASAQYLDGTGANMIYTMKP